MHSFITRSRFFALATSCMLAAWCWTEASAQPIWRYFMNSTVEEDAYRASGIIVGDPDGDGPIDTTLIGTMKIGLPPAVYRVVYWKDGRWFPLGGPFNDSISSLCMWDLDGDGPQPLRVVAAGSFDNIDGEAISRVAWWSGTQWRPIGSGIPSSLSVEHVVAWDSDGAGPGRPKLVVAAPGPAGPGSYGGALIWNGVSWAALPIKPSANDDIHGLYVWDADGAGPSLPKVVFLGDFTRIGGIDANSIAVWDGSQWSTLGSGITGEVAYAVNAATWDRDQDGVAELLVVGGYVSVGGIPQNGLFAWDGTQWIEFGTLDVHQSTRVLEFVCEQSDGSTESVLVVGGRFEHSNPQGIRGIGMWDGNEWSSMDRGTEGYIDQVHDLVSLDFDGSGPLPSTVVGYGQSLLFEDYANGSSAFAVWDKDKWRPLHDPSGSDPRAACYWDPDGPGPRRAVAVVAGDFTWVGIHPAQRLSYWDSRRWRELGGGLTGSVRTLTTIPSDAMQTDGDLLVVGGANIQAGTSPLGDVAIWNGVSWTTHDLGVTSGSVTKIINVHGSHIHGVPDSTLLIAAHYNGISIFDGHSWTRLGADLPRQGQVCLWDMDGDGPLLPRLVTATSGIEPRYIRMWNGTVWETLASFWYTPLALNQWDPDGGGPQAPLLLMAGNLSRVNGVNMTGIASFDGVTWQQLGPLSGDVNQLLVVPNANSGEPDRLIAIGNILSNPLHPTTTCAEWNATTWWWDLLGGLLFKFGKPYATDDFIPTVGAFHSDDAGVRILVAGDGAGAEFALPEPVITQTLATPVNCSGATIEVKAYAVPYIMSDPVEVKWYFNGSQLQASEKIQIEDLQDGVATLVVSPATATDAGIYQCEIVCAYGVTRGELVHVDPFAGCCPADYNRDSIGGDILDFLDFFEDFAACEGQPAPCGTRGNPDINADTLVDILDFLDFFEAFGTGC